MEQTPQMRAGGQPNGSSQMNQDAARFDQNPQTGRQSSETQQPGKGGNAMATQNAGQGRQMASSAKEGGANEAGSGSFIRPPVDIFEDAHGFTVIADMPGVSKDQLVVRVTGDNLVIEGTATVQTSGNVELLYGEVNNPQYRRSFTLSRELDPGKIEAKLNNGVLRLTIPKAETAKPRRIQVNVG